MSLVLKRNIVLVGLMGCGKSAIGKRLAKRLATPFTDIDHKIEDQQGAAVSEIFESMGEEKFREMEKSTILETLDENPHIIATGGGAYIRPEIRQAVDEKAGTVWLNADMDVLVERVSRKNTRPLLAKGNKREIMEKLAKERYPVYEQAEIMVKSTEGPHNKVVDDIVQKLEEHGYLAA